MDLGSLGAAVCAVWGHRLLGCDNGQEAHLEFVEGDMGLVDIDEELAGENGAGRCLGAIVEDDGRRLDAHVHGSDSLGLDLGALLVGVVLVMLVAVEDIHDERLFGLCLSFCRGLVGIDGGKEGLGVRFAGVQLGQWGGRHPDEGTQQAAGHSR